MDKKTGISIMKIVPKLDAGPYMLQKSINIELKDNFMSLSDKLSEIGSNMILEAISLLEKGKSQFTDQDEKLATYAKKIDKKESQIMWNELSQKLIAKINGLNPNPGAWFEHKGNRIKILDAEIFEDKGKAGEVLTNNLIIGCKDKAIKINLIQKEGKKVIDTKSFLAGYKISKGDILK